ncbi:hypothetical protein PV326_013287, partial [Microctonus aethiopoides]
MRDHALIRWISSGLTDVIPINSIKPKDREEKKKVSLLYHDKVKNTKTYHAAEIIEISNKSEVENMIIDENGDIVDASKKAFSSNVLAKRERGVLASEQLRTKKNVSSLSGESSLSAASKQQMHQFDSSNIQSSKMNENGSDEDDEEDEPQHCQIDEYSTTITNKLHYSQPHTFVIPDVTLEQLQFQKRLLASMEYSYNLKIVSQLPQQLEKEEIFKSITEILVEIYGGSLKYLSDKGSRGSTGIHRRVYSAVHRLICERVGQIIPEKDFVKHINKVCNNRKFTKQSINLEYHRQESNNVVEKHQDNHNIYKADDQRNFV